MCKNIYKFLDEYFLGITNLINFSPFYILNTPFLPLTIFRLRATFDYLEINHTQRQKDNSLFRTEWMVIKCDHFYKSVIPIDGGSDTDPDLDRVLKTNFFGEEPRIFFLASWLENLEKQGFLNKLKTKIDWRKKHFFKY